MVWSGGVGVVAGGCENYPTEAGAVPKPAMNHWTKKVEAWKQIREPIQYHVRSHKTTPDAVKVHAKNMDKKVGGTE